MTDLSAADLEDAVVRLLKEESRAFTAGQIKTALAAQGVPQSALDSKWSAAQKKLSKRSDVIYTSKTYKWTDSPTTATPKPARPKPATPKAATQPPAAALSPAEALELIAKGTARGAKREQLFATVRNALQQNAPAPPSNPTVPIEKPPAAEGDPGRHEHPVARQAQPAKPPAPPEMSSASAQALGVLQQANIDTARALAQLAMEVEELSVNGADATVMVHRVRARVRQSGLEPFERSGDETTFDAKRHRPFGRAIDDGASVVVVRPGYSWLGPDGDLLTEKAVVQR